PAVQPAHARCFSWPTRGGPPGREIDPDAQYRRNECQQGHHHLHHNPARAKPVQPAPGMDDVKEGFECRPPAIYGKREPILSGFNIEPYSVRPFEVDPVYGQQTVYELVFIVELG